MDQPKEKQKIPIEDLARLSGLPLKDLVYLEKALAERPKTPQQFRKEHQVRLAWSNPNVSDEVLIRKALLSGYFTIILDAVRSFGLDQVKNLWILMQDEEEKIDTRILKMTSVSIKDIEYGYRESARINKIMSDPGPK